MDDNPGAPLRRTVAAYVLLLLPLLVHASIRTAHPIELTIKSGSIRGEYLRIKGNDYAVFKGIPYAAPPVGALRFKKPEKPAEWRGVMNATQYSAMCVQKTDQRITDPERHSFHFSEDCLYLNVFAPTQFTNETYPVIVLIHGGGFQRGGSNDFHQQAILDNFVSRKIVLITFNYRLGVMGFASAGDSTFPGNNGLWDMIMALDWVKLNSPVFGGDSDNVMLMGSGSGASAASILALSPRAEGRFHKVLLMSGTALSPGAVRDVAINATENLAAKLHCRAEKNSSQMLECFRFHIKDELLDVARMGYDDYEEFVPMVDGLGGVIPEPPEVLASYRPKVPLMIGTTKDESALRIVIVNEKNLNLSSLNTQIAEQLAENLTMSYTGFVNTRLITEGVKHEYIWTKIDPSMPDTILYNSILKMYSHFWYDAPASRLASFYAKQKAPVFLYSFDHISENIYDYDRAFHGVDKLHLFNITPRFLARRRDMNWQLDQRVIEIFSDLIVNFVKYGHPTPDNSGFAFNWTTLNLDELNYLSVTDSPVMEVGYRWQGHVFWNWYARHLDAVDVGNWNRIEQLDKQLGDYQLATWVSIFTALFFFAILVGLGCYCTRKDSDDDEV